MAPFTRFGPWLGLLCLLYLAGCSGGRRPNDELANAVSQGERPVAMKGESLFFDKQLRVTVTVSRGIGKGTMGPGGGGHHHEQAIADIDHMDDDERKAYITAKISIGSPMPPVTIHLRIENLGAQVVSVDIHDFNSDLGNFAVHPEVIAIAPAQISEPDPMISQMGVSSDIIPMTVSLVLNGQKETQVIQVKNIMTPPKEGG